MKADVSKLIDFGPWTAVQKSILFFTALAIIFDGFDNQLVGFAIPAIIKEWGVTRAALSTALALGLAGMAIGSGIAGYVGDRFGRKIALVGCVLFFGLSTLGGYFVTSVFQLGLVRLFAGMGIGGAIPNASAYTAEFTPLRRRALAVSLTIVCVPLGGMVAGEVAARLMPTLGWRVLFVVGGIVPILYALALWFVLPESPRYLARRPQRWPELARLLTRIGRPTEESSSFADVAEERLEGKTAWTTLFGAGQLSNTLALWLSFFCCMSTVYLTLGWLPALLAARGLDLAASSRGLGSWNTGGVIGLLIFAPLISPFGSRVVMLTAVAGAFASAFAFKLVDMSPAGDPLTLNVALAAQGFFVNAVQTTLYALAAHVYPTKVRSTGVAAAAAVGRVGGIIVSFVGPSVIRPSGGAFQDVLMAGLACVFIGLALIRNHIPSNK